MDSIIIWRRLDLPGHEMATLESQGDEWELKGTAVFVHGQDPCKLDYTVRCDSVWQTISAQVKGRIGDQQVELNVTVDSDRKWYLNEIECPAVAGCTDIDLGFSPSTNLLPIRRLSLNIGEKAEVRAAWLPFPALNFELLPQVYHRKEEHEYKYESVGGRFERMLEVNVSGFVTNYPGLWQSEIDS